MALATAFTAMTIAVPGANAAGQWVITGAGFGHGIGMSQYGAYGSAKNGLSYDAILGQYYTGTTLGTAQSQTVRVLLRPYLPAVRFSGASAACGATLTESATYTAKRKGSKVALEHTTGRPYASIVQLLDECTRP